MAIATYFWGLLIGVDKRFAASPDLKPKPQGAQKEKLDTQDRTFLKNPAQKSSPILGTRIKPRGLFKNYLSLPLLPSLD